MGNVCLGYVNLLPLRQDVSYFAEATFKFIFLYENYCILIQISTKFVPKCSVYNKSALVQVMAWCWTGDSWTGDKPLPESMLNQFTDAYVRYFWAVS